MGWDGGGSHTLESDPEASGTSHVDGQLHLLLLCLLCLPCAGSAMHGICNAWSLPCSGSAMHGILISAMSHCKRLPHRTLRSRQRGTAAPPSNPAARPATLGSLNRSHPGAEDHIPPFQWTDPATHLEHEHILLLARIRPDPERHVNLRAERVATEG